MIAGRTRAVLAAAAMAVAVLALAGCASAAGRHTGTAAGADLASHRSAATVHHTFDPYDKAGKLTVGVTRRASGSCWATSLADPGPTTYRCFAGNEILDPCFAAPGATTAVACVADPWSKATVLSLTKALPKTSSNIHRVWAFVRSGGARCVAATGTVPEVAGRDLEYNCSNGTYASLDDVHGRRVQAVYARIASTSLSTSFVRDIWTS